MIGGSLFLAPFKSVRWYDICHIIDFFSMPFIGRYAQTFISMYYTSHQLWFNGLLTITLLHIYTLQKYRKLKRNRIVACKTCPIICKELFDVKYWIKTTLPDIGIGIYEHGITVSPQTYYLVFDYVCLIYQITPCTISVCTDVTRKSIIL